MLISHDTGLLWADVMQIVLHLQAVDRVGHLRRGNMLFLKDKHNNVLRLEGKKEAIDWAIYELKMTLRWGHIMDYSRPIPCYIRDSDGRMHRDREGDYCYWEDVEKLLKEKGII